MVGNAQETCISAANFLDSIGHNIYNGVTESGEGAGTGEVA